MVSIKLYYLNERLVDKSAIKKNHSLVNKKRQKTKRQTITELFYS